MIEQGAKGDARKAAAFLVEALQLNDDPAMVAPELTLVDRNQVVSVFAAEFESSVGPAAFLVYVYRLNQVGDDGRLGKIRFEDDLQTLDTAARLDTPGPRLVGHSQVDDDALILATSPAVLRALRGEQGPGGDPTARKLPDDLVQTRGDLALELLQTLRAADQAAEAWLAAIDAHGSMELTPEEIELSLFLHDERSIRSLLQALNRLMAATNSPPRQAGA